MKEKRAASLIGKAVTILVLAIMTLSFVACARDVYVERTTLPSIDDKKAE